jgi:MSHA biogenesis protein MshO
MRRHRLSVEGRVESRACTTGTSARVGASRRRVRGFTLIEMVAALVIVAILSAFMAVFLQAPLQTYFDVTGRAQLADASNLAIQRMSLDLSTALPNSVRITQIGGVVYLEYLQVRTGGRYRTGAPLPAGCPAPSAAIDFGAADTCFVTMGPLTGGLAPQVGNDFVVVDNQGLGCPNNAYASGNVTGGSKSLITGFAVFGGAQPYDRIQMQAINFPLICQSPTDWFYVISQAVSYECNPTTGLLVVHSGYPISAVQPTAFAAGVSAQLASGLTSCSMTYFTNTNSSTTSGTVSATLVFSRTDPAATGNTESLTVFTQLHVSDAL